MVSASVDSWPRNKVFNLKQTVNHCLGLFDENNPFLSLLLSPDIVKHYPELRFSFYVTSLALQENTRGVVAPADVDKTLRLVSNFFTR